MTRYEVVITDTFGGELNYSWVRRAVIEVDDTATDVSIVRKAKKAVNYNGVKMVKEYDGMYRVVGACIAMTIECITA